MKRDGYHSKGTRRGSLSFDSMKQRRGISYDINNEFAGLDVHTRFDVVTREFRAMAKKEVSFQAPSAADSCTLDPD